jgi:serine/threonine protein kinase
METTIAHCRILEKIGEGGMGVVYRAEDTRLGRQVAIKLLPARVAAREDLRVRLLREARTVSESKSDVWIIDNFDPSVQ